MTAPWTQRERALYEALEATPCRCSKAIKNACPTCGETLVAVRYSGYLNSDQWDAIKGGDWYCNTCTDPSIVNGKKHWHDRELETITYQQCSRCAALSDQPPADPRDAALRLAEKSVLASRQRFTHLESCTYDSSGDLGLCSCGHWQWASECDAALTAIRAAKGER